MSDPTGGGFDFGAVGRYGWAVAGSVLAWVGRGHISHDATIHANVFGRITVLEKEAVTKDELKDLNDKVDKVLFYLMKAG